MRAYHVIIAIVGLVAISGVATAQNAPCPDCDPDGEGVDNSYHSVDAGFVDANTTHESAELLADTDVAYDHHPESDKGFWLWFALCLSAFVDAVEDAVGLHTDVDANVETYADSEGVDVDASVSGLGHLCGFARVNMTCDQDFDESELGGVDGMTHEAIAAIEATTGEDVWIPSVVPETEDSDTDACVRADLSLC